jgi:DNA-binding NarL/FixJ family response regulator
MPDALIIDDNAGFRASARSLLETEGFAVVNEAATGLEGINAVRQRRPELVLLDIQLPDIDGFEVAEQLAQLEHPPTVILTSSRDGADYGSLVSTSAARGFIPKSDLSGAAVRAMLGV